MPKVSIVIPTFNRMDFLPETIESIRAQVFEDWECLVIDDGSTDGTDAFMQKIASEDSRFKYLHRPKDRKKGANACRNYGFEISQGEYVKWFDSDDVMHPEFISSQAKALDSDKTLAFAACLGYYFADSLENLEPINPYTKREEGLLVYNYIARGFYLLTPAPLWRKSFLSGMKLFDESLSRGQETDFHFRVICGNPNFLYTHERLYFIRRGNDSVSTKAVRNKSAQKSAMEVFGRMFENVRKMPKGEMRSLLLKHLAYKQLYNVYKLRIHHLAGVSEFYGSTWKVVSGILKYSPLGFGIKSKVVLGYGFMAFNKGYKWLHLPEFDLSKTKANPKNLSNKQKSLF